MIFFVIASIGFFLFSFITILHQVTFWQINGYRLSRLRLYQKQQKKKLSKRILLPMLLLLAIVVYGLVIFHEGFAVWYQLGVAALFCVLGFLSLKNSQTSLLWKPFTTFVSCAIALLSSVTVVFLYLIPLVDQFLWILILSLFLPLIVIAFVELFAFPIEIYSDMIMQRAKKKIDSLHNVPIVLVTGNSEKHLIKQHISHMLSSYRKIVTNKPEKETPFSLAKVIQKQVTKNTQLILFTVHTTEKDAVDKLVAMLHPDILILSGIPKTYEDFPKEKKEYLLTQQVFIEALSRNSVILLNGENEDFFALVDQLKKTVLLYGTEYDAHKKRFAILGYDIHVRKDGIWFGFKIGRKKISYKTKLRAKKTVQTLLPAIFLAHIFHIPSDEIEKLVKSLGRVVVKK